jgi:hypothetical protein
MTIHDLAASHLRAGSSLRPKELNGSKDKDGLEAVSEARGPDKVEISDEARTLAAQADATPEEGNELSEERILLIRRWIDDGFYDLPTTVEEVARRILASGDLDL